MELPAFVSNSLGFPSLLSMAKHLYYWNLSSSQLNMAAVKELSECSLKGRVGMKAESSIPPEKEPWKAELSPICSDLFEFWTSPLWAY